MSHVRHNAGIKKETYEVAFSMLDGMPGMVWRSGRDGKRDFFNKSWLGFTGKNLEQEIGDGWIEGIHPEDVGACLQEMVTAITRGQAFTVTYRLRYADGSYHNVNDQGSPYYDDEGRITGYIGTCQDVSIRLTIQNSQESHEDLPAFDHGNSGDPGIEHKKLLQMAAENAPVIFFNIDRDGILRLTMGNSLSRRLRNVEPVGRSIYELYRDNPQVTEAFERTLKGETVRVIVEGGGSVYETTYMPNINEQGEVVSVLGVATDVTPQHQAEAALRRSEAYFQTIFQNAMVGIKLIDLQGRIVEANPAFMHMVGYDDQELFHLTYTDLTHPEDAPNMRARLEELTAGKIDHFEVEKRYLHKEGKIKWGKLVMSLFRASDGTPLYGIGMVEDITARKETEAELAEVQRRLVDSTELERLHLAQELHDGPLQDLQAMAYSLAMLQSMVDEDGRQEVHVLETELHKVSASLRGICGDLRPPALAPFGLERAIRSHAEQFSEKNPQLRLHLDLEKDGKELPERVRLAIFRIYQHSLANIVRHAGSSDAWISFRLNEDTIELIIVDNGKGFKVPRRWVELVRQGHFGLVGSIERAESVGGRLEVESELEKGTTIHVIVPRREEEQITPRERWSNVPRKVH